MVLLTYFEQSLFINKYKFTFISQRKLFIKQGSDHREFVLENMVLGSRRCVFIYELWVTVISSIGEVASY